MRSITVSSTLAACAASVQHFGHYGQEKSAEGKQEYNHERDVMGEVPDVELQGPDLLCRPGNARVSRLHQQNHEALHGIGLRIEQVLVTIQHLFQYPFQHERPSSMCAHRIISSD